MSPSTTKTKRVWSVALLLNPVAAYYFKCPAETRRAMRNIAVILLFSATICGFILASSIIKFGFKGNYHYWWVIFPACGLFYFLLDKALVFTHPKSNRTGIAGMRITIALILGLSNSALIDTYYYGDDIRGAQATEVARIEAGVNAEHDRAKAQLMAARQTFLYRIDSIKAQLSVKRTALNQEADGTGGSRARGRLGIWEAKYLTYHADSVSAESQIALLLKEIGRLDGDLTRNDSVQTVHIAAIPGTLNLGINRNMELLHRIIWTQGSFTTKFMCILFLFLTLLLELLPLLAMSRYDISKYFERAEQDSQRVDAVAIMMDTVQKQLATERATIQLRAELMGINFAAHLKELDDKIYYQGQVFERQIRAIKAHDTNDQQFARDYPKQYPSSIKPALDQLLNNLNDAINTALQV